MKTLNILSAPDRRAHQDGFSLIEIMVGVVIGMIAVLVIYQVFAAAEGIKRNTTSAGDAQQNGLLASFMLGVELANASNGVAMAWQKLQSCPTTTNPERTTQRTLNRSASMLRSENFALFIWETSPRTRNSS